MDTAVACLPLSDRINGFRTTVYLTRVSPEVKLRGKTLVFGKTPKFRELPVANLRQVIFLGIPRCDGQLLYKLLMQGIPTFFMSMMGKPLGSIVPQGGEPQPLWREQECFAADMPARFTLAKRMVEAKISNAERLLCAFGLEEERLPNYVDAVPDGDWNVLRGYEGVAARRFFDGVARLAHSFTFTGRIPRFAPDPVNAMLSLGYSLLYQRLAAALQRMGLHPRIGYYHCGRGRHYALASDLLEDLRCLVDGFVLRLLERKSLTPEDFTMRGKQCTFRTGHAFALFLNGFEEMAGKRFTAPVERPGLAIGQRTNLNEWLDLTAEAYAAMLRTGRSFVPFRLAARSQKRHTCGSSSADMTPAAHISETVEASTPSEEQNTWEDTL